jgi:hypothetical protein
MCARHKRGRLAAATKPEVEQPLTRTEDVNWPQRLRLYYRIMQRAVIG